MKTQEIETETGNKVKITTNNIPRPVVHGWELTAEELKEFDYLKGEQLWEASFFRYRGEVYNLGEFSAFNRSFAWLGAPEEYREWDGYMSDSFFSGILVKYSEDCEEVIVATYIGG